MTNDNVKWETKSVPKERCEAEIERLKSDGWIVEDGCKEDPQDKNRCIIKYRPEY